MGDCCMVKTPPSPRILGPEEEEREEPIDARMGAVQPMPKNRGPNGPPSRATDHGEGRKGHTPNFPYQGKTERKLLYRCSPPKTL